MPFFLGDSYFWIIIIPLLLLSFAAQAYVQSTFKKFSTIRVDSNFNSNQAVQEVLKGAGFDEIKIERIAGNLTDHFDPRNNVIRLSERVFESNSVAAIGVAAHEAGHAVQNRLKYGPMKIRGAIAPVANITSQAAPLMVIMGMFTSFNFLINLGLILFTIAVAFYIITLPVEFNASLRAISSLENMGRFSEKEIKGVKKVLTAAALTYIVSAAMALGNLLRLFLLSRDRR